MDRVSIIIPAKNEENNISRCLNSVNVAISNYNGNAEIILVDNGSSDQTIVIAKKYDCKIFIRPDLKISGLRNYGVSQSSGDILAFVDADMTVNYDWIKCGVNALKVRDVVCVGGYIDIPEKSTWVERAWHMNFEAMSNKHTIDWVPSMNMFVRKKDFLSVNGFNEELVTCEDVDLCYRLKLLGLIKYDSRISSTHYGEAKTLKHFYQKEKWRGQGNIKGVLSHKINIKELPSILIPLYYNYSLITLPLILFKRAKCNIILNLIAIMIFPIIRTLWTSSRANNYNYIVPLTILWFVYYIARGMSMISSTNKRK